MGGGEKKKQTNNNKNKKVKAKAKAKEKEKEKQKQKGKEFQVSLGLYTHNIFSPVILILSLVSVSRQVSHSHIDDRRRSYNTLQHHLSLGVYYPYLIMQASKKASRHMRASSYFSLI